MRIICCYILMTIFIWSACCILASETTRGEHAHLRSACEYDYPPFCVVKDKKASGFSVDLLRAVLAVMEREVTFEVGAWQSIKEKLERGEINVLPLVSKSSQRDKWFDFSFPYATMHGVIVVRDSTSDINRLEDLRGRKVELLGGDSAEEFMRKAGTGAEIITKDSFLVALKDLSAGNCEAVVIQKLLALRLIKENKIANLRFAVKTLPDFKQDFCFAVREGNKELLAVLNEGLALVIANGTFSSLYRKWVGSLENSPHSRIIVGGDYDYAPFEYIDDNGNPAGFNVELTKALAKEAGLDVYIRLGPWAEIREGLENGEIDMVQGMFYSLERDKKYQFSQAHSIVKHVFVSRKPVSVSEGIDDLRGKDIVVMRKDIMHDFALKNKLTDKLTLVDSQEEALKQLAEGKHDYALVGQIPALYLIKKKGWDNLLVSNIALLAPEYCYAVMPENINLVAKFTEAMAALEKSGKYYELRQKWMGVYSSGDTSLEKILSYISLFIVFLLVLLIVAFLWSRTLQREITNRTSEIAQKTALLEAMLESSIDGIIVVDPKMKIILQNRLCAEMWQIPDDILYSGDDKKQVDYVKQLVEDTDRFAEKVKYLYEHPLAVSRDEISLKSGMVIDRYSAPVLGPDNQLFGRLWGFRDITERKKDEEIIRHYAHIVSFSPDMMSIVGLDYKFLAVNDAYARAFNMSKEEILGRHVRDVVGDKLFDEVILPISKKCITEGSVSYARWFDIPQKGMCYCRVLYFPFRDEKGAIAGFSVHVQDVTEQKISEDKVLQSEKKYRTLFDLMIDGFALYELICVDGKAVDYRFLDVNPAFERITGLKAGEIINRTACEVITFPEDIWVMEFSTVVHTGESVRFGRFCKSFDKFLDVLCYKTDGNGFAVIYVDRTESRKAEERLRQTEKMNAIGQLAGGIAHDFNNQLTCVMGYAELLDDLTEDAKLKEYAGNIKQGVESAASLTSQLLAFSRKGKYISRAVDLNKVIKTVANLLVHSIDKKVEVIEKFKQDSVFTQGDPNQLQNAILNIALNARDAMPEGGRLIFETDCVSIDEALSKTFSQEISPGEFVCVSVSDTGMGMDEEIVRHIFEPFFTTKSAERGTGMGLASVYGTVRNHKGAVNVYSELEVGTTFRLYLPQCSDDGCEMAPKEKHIPVAGTASILVVDDEEMIRKLSVSMLASLGYKVHTCANGLEAVEYYRRNWQQTDLVVLDMIMPVMGGKDAFLEMKKINPDILAVLATGYSIDGQAQSILDEGVKEYIGKPFTQTGFTQVVARVLLDKKEQA